MPSANRYPEPASAGFFLRCVRLLLAGWFCLGLVDGVECFPDSNYSEIPASVKIGESGVLGSTTCSDGTTFSAAYVVERSTRKSSWAAIVVYATAFQPGQADIFEDITFHHSQDGRIQALEIVAGDGSVSFDLRS
jgi:hypothetical protein